MYTTWLQVVSIRPISVTKKMNHKLTSRRTCNSQKLELHYHGTTDNSLGDVNVQLQRLQWFSRFSQPANLSSMCRDHRYNETAKTWTDRLHAKRRILSVKMNFNFVSILSTAYYVVLSLAIIIHIVVLIIPSSSISHSPPFVANAFQSIPSAITPPTRISITQMHQPRIRISSRLLRSELDTKRTIHESRILRGFAKKKDDESGNENYLDRNESKEVNNRRKKKNDNVISSQASSTRDKTKQQTNKKKIKTNPKKQKISNNHSKTINKKKSNSTKKNSSKKIIKQKKKKNHKKDNKNNIIKILSNPYEAGQQFRQTIDRTLNLGKQPLTPQQKSIYYFDDRFLESGTSSGSVGSGGSTSTTSGSTNIGIASSSGSGVNNSGQLPSEAAMAFAQRQSDILEEKDELYGLLDENAEYIPEVLVIGELLIYVYSMFDGLYCLCRICKMPLYHHFSN